MTDLTKWVKIRESVKKIGWRYITTKIFTDPDGNEQSYVTWSKPGEKSAAVIALTKEMKVIIAEQFRQGPEAILAELPGGLIDPGEESYVAAARELIEETGYVSNEPLEYLGSTHRDAYNNLESEYFLAVNCYQELQPETIADEYIVVKLLSIDEFLSLATTGKITDSAGVLMAYDKLKALQKG
jgi:ADP-ribose pyrophosphatase